MVFRSVKSGNKALIYINGTFIIGVPKERETAVLCLLVRAYTK